MFASTSKLVNRLLSNTSVHITMPSVIRNMSSAVEAKNDLAFKSLNVTNVKPFVFHVEFNRPEKYNAMNNIMWREIKSCFESLSTNPDCRVIVVSANGKHFTAGIDLQDMIQLGEDLGKIEDVSRKGLFLGKKIKLYQEAFTSLELCNKPVITAVHSACVGAGVDFITAADIRYCSQDAWFQVKEVDIGMAADVGTLQRLPKVIGSQSLVRELCFTARKVDSKEAFNCGLISKIFNDKESMLQEAFKVAEDIASKSPVAVQATKKNIVYSQNRTNQEGLDHIREMNQLLLQSEDFLNATVAQLSREKPIFSKL